MAAARPTRAEAFRFWLRLGFISFGGPAGQIAVMHTELVERRRWIGERQFLHALNYCMLLPGPEATQLAIYCGWLLHGTWGGIIAGVLFVLPAIALLWTLSVVYVTFGQVAWIAAVFAGLKPAVTAIVAHAVLRIGHRALTTPALWAVAALAFGAIYFLHVPFPLIVAGAAVLGLGAGGMGWTGFQRVDAVAAPGRVGQGGPAIVPDSEWHLPVRPTWTRSGRVLTFGLLIWWLPVFAAGLWQGWGGTLVREGVFFSKAAMVTFGGAYAVLPYVGQEAVEHFGWLSGAQMLDGLGLAETTPGPLIMVVQFVGFLGGWHHPGAQPPLLAATLGALITTWTTFVPSFLWILLGAPHIEQLRGKARYDRPLNAITAAVVGVVLNLAVWFGAQVFHPAAGRIDWFAVTLAGAAFGALRLLNASVVTVVLGSGVVGLLGWLAS